MNFLTVFVIFRRKKFLWRIIKSFCLNTNKHIVYLVILYLRKIHKNIQFGFFIIGLLLTTLALSHRLSAATIRPGLSFVGSCWRRKTKSSTLRTSTKNLLSSAPKFRLSFRAGRATSCPRCWSSSGSRSRASFIIETKRLRSLSSA